MIRKITFCLVLCAITVSAFSQTNKTDESSLPEIKGNYLGISAGMTFGSMRDMSTSPLFYSAILPSVAIDYASIHDKWVYGLNFTTLNGFYLSLMDTESYSTTANIFDFDIFVFNNFMKSNDDRFKQFIGGSMTNSSHIRINQSYGNAALAFNNFSDINLNYKVSFQYRLAEKKKKFLKLIPYTRKEKFFLLSGKVGVPVYTLVYSPGYTNPGNSTLNSDLLFDGYEYNSKIFSGINTDISISRILKNGNMTKFSYIWNARTTGSVTESTIDIAHHTFIFTLVFKIN